MAEDNSGTKFPSHFVPSSVKESKAWMLKYSEAFHSEAGFLPTESALTKSNKTYQRMRAYARGEQSQLQYKELIGLKKDKGGNPNTSFRNLNFEILKVAPKIRNVVVNKIVNHPLNMKAKPIDPQGISDRKKEKSKLLEFIINKQHIENFERLTKLGLERPVPPGEIPPDNIREIEPYLDMNPKDIQAMETLDFLTAAFHDNDWNQIGREVAGDIFDIGVGGTRQYIDVDSKIKFRRIDPERSRTNKCIYPDYRDMIRFGEYIEITISDLRKYTKGEWGEETYKDIANKHCGSSNKNSYSHHHLAYYDNNNYSYAYDHEKITVFEWMCYSTDTEVHVEFTNEVGNRRLKREKPSYVPFKGDASINEGRGLSDEEYSALYQGKRKIHRTEIKNVYQCSWIVGSEYIYNSGLMKNMLRSAGNWQETVMPVVLVSTDFISTMSLLEQPLDQVQLNYLQFQSHVASSKPPGIAIEMHALARVGKVGKGGLKWDPKKDLEMYAESGNVLYNGYDAHGNPLGQIPIMELKNGLSPGAQEHLNLVMQFIELIRSMVGINALTEGQTPPERTGKTVAELSFGATDNALSHLIAAYKSVYEKTARNMFYLFQNNLHRMHPDAISESLGAESYKYFMLNRDLSLRDMGIILEEGPNDIIREKISNLLQLMVENKEIPGEDAIMIEMQKDNPYRQVLMIRKHRQEREQAEAARQENIVRAQGEENTKTAVATEQEAQRTLELAAQQKFSEREIQHQFDQDIADKKFTYEMLLNKAKNNDEMDAQEKEFIHEIMIERIRAESALKKQRLMKQQQSKSKSK